MRWSSDPFYGRVHGNATYVWKEREKIETVRPLGLGSNGDLEHRDKFSWCRYEAVVSVVWYRGVRKWSSLKI